MIIQPARQPIALPLRFLGGVLLASFYGTAFAATLSVQTATNKLNYGQSSVVTVKANAENGTNRITTSQIRYANVTIKNPSGTTLLNGVAMSKDTATGFAYYNYTLSSSAPKGTYTSSVSFTDTSGNTGTGLVSVLTWSKSTTTALTSSPNPSATLQPVLLTATVTPAAAVPPKVTWALATKPVPLIVTTDPGA